MQYLTTCDGDINKGSRMWNIFRCHRWEERTFWVGQEFRTHRNKGDDKPRGTELTSKPELVNFTFYQSLWQFSFAPKRKKARPYLYGWNESCWHYRKKQFQVYEPLVEDILVGVMLWGECSPRCSKICSCLSLEMTTRKGRKHGKGTVQFRKQTLSSLTKTHSFFQYQELITACLPFLGSYLLDSEKDEIKS